MDNLNDHVISLSFDINDRLIRAVRLGYFKTDTYEVVERVQIVEKVL
jgi:hypothetical protein